jgi:hypothetical protein
MTTFEPTERPETNVVAMNARSCPNPTAAMGMAPSPPTRNTATMPSVRWRRLLIVTGRARVNTDFLICAMLEAMGTYPSRTLSATT